MERCVFLFLILFGLWSCNKASKSEKNYIYVEGTDTSRLRLLLYDNRFFGDLVHTKAGSSATIGKINGDIEGDLLIGDNLYKPFRWKENKRVPIVLLRQGDNYIEGTGMMIEVMGILTYNPTSINFENPKRIYRPVD